jgi:hypothetical protein
LNDNKKTFTACSIFHHIQRRAQFGVVAWGLPNPVRQHETIIVNIYAGVPRFGRGLIAERPGLEPDFPVPQTNRLLRQLRCDIRPRDEYQNSAFLRQRLEVRINLRAVCLVYFGIYAINFVAEIFYIAVDFMPVFAGIRTIAGDNVNLFHTRLSYLLFISPFHKGGSRGI